MAACRGLYKDYMALFLRSRTGRYMVVSSVCISIANLVAPMAKYFGINILGLVFLLLIASFVVALFLQKEWSRM